MKPLRNVLRRAVIPSLAVVTAFILGAIVLVLTDTDHLQNLGTDPVGALGGAIGTMANAYGALFAGAIGDPGRIVTAIQSGDPSDIAGAIRPATESLLTATPFIFVCLGLAIAFHSGLFNLGADGQFLIGGFGAATAATVLGGALPPMVVLAVALGVGALSGAAFGFVPGLLKARTGAHEVITTLMLNVIAPNLAGLIAGAGLFGRSTVPLPKVPLIFDLRTIRLDYGFIAALIVAALVSFLLFRTTVGFELRATGFSPSVARGAGIRPGRTTMIAMTLSGGLVGLGSAFFLLGPANGLGGGPTRGMGYVALALALIAGLRPSGVVLVAILFGVLNNGALSMGIESGIPLDLLLVIITFALMFVAAPSLTRMIWRLRPPAQGPETAPIGVPSSSDVISGL